MPIELDSDECPECRGWNCTRTNPHKAWIKGTQANLLRRARDEEIRQFQKQRDERERLAT